MGKEINKNKMRKGDHTFIYLIEHTT